MACQLHGVAAWDGLMTACEDACVPQEHLSSSGLSLLRAAMAHGLVVPDFALRVWADRPAFVAAVAGIEATGTASGAMPQHEDCEAGEAAIARALQQQLPLHMALSALAVVIRDSRENDPLVTTSSPLRAVLLRHPAQLYTELTGAGSPWQQSAMAGDRKVLPAWCDLLWNMLPHNIRASEAKGGLHVILGKVT